MRRPDGQQCFLGTGEQPRSTSRSIPPGEETGHPLIDPRFQILREYSRADPDFADRVEKRGGLSAERRIGHRERRQPSDTECDATQYTVVVGLMPS